MKTNITEQIKTIDITEQVKTIEVSFDRAKQWYKSRHNVLRHFALQLFTEEELTENMHYTEIVDFYNAVYALKLDSDVVAKNILALGETDSAFKSFYIASYELEIIRKALNRGWEPAMEETFYCICPKGKNSRSPYRFDIVKKRRTSRLTTQVKLLSCKSEEIAKHMIINFTDQLNTVLNQIRI